MDLATLIRKQSQPIADTKIGRMRIHLYALTVDDMHSISKLADEGNSFENHKSLIRIISSLKKPDKSNKRVALTEEFINSLSQAELNMLAESYLETPYAKNINQNLKNPILKNTDEENIKYLYRLLRMYVIDYGEKNREIIRKALDPFRNVREASLTLSNKINTYDFSSHIAEQAKTAHNQRKQELEMTRVTAEMSKESANLLNKLTIDVTNFLESWRTETEKNNATTKTQLKIAVGSLIVSVFLSCLALYYSYNSYMQDLRNNEESNKTQQDITNLLGEANKNSSTLVEQNSILEHRILELVESQKIKQQKTQDSPTKLAK